jgi:hypothetical protein
MKFRTDQHDERILSHRDDFGDELEVVVTAESVIITAVRSVILTHKEFNKLARKTRREIEDQEV